jgi:hypothetical protein
METAITVRARGGRTWSQELRYPPLTSAEIEQKFRTLAGTRLASAPAMELQRKLNAVESIANVAPLIRELEIPYS